MTEGSQHLDLEASLLDLNGGEGLGKEVVAFARRMVKALDMAQRDGRRGWRNCPVERLAYMLIAHVEKGDPVDIANFAMMLSALGVTGNGGVIAQKMQERFVPRAVVRPADEQGDAACVTFTVANQPDETQVEPLPLRLNCPSCGVLHVDEGEWAARPHHTHACQECGHVWRPAVVNTVGVRFLPGFRNEAGQ